MAYDRLAFILRATGRTGDAVALLDEAARGGHADRSLLRSLGSMLRDTGNLDRSAAVLERPGRRRRSGSAIGRCAWPDVHAHGPRTACGSTVPPRARRLPKRRRHLEQSRRAVSLGTSDGRRDRRVDARGRGESRSRHRAQWTRRRIRHAGRYRRERPPSGRRRSRCVPATPTRSTTSNGSANSGCSSLFEASRIDSVHKKRASPGGEALDLHQSQNQCQRSDSDFRTPTGTPSGRRAGRARR